MLRSNQIHATSALTLNQLCIVIAPTLFGFMVNMLHSYQFAFIIVGMIVYLGAVNLYRTFIKNAADEKVMFTENEQ